MTYTIDPCDPLYDRAPVLGLWTRNFPEATEDRYCWLYEDGPATGWVLKSDQGEVVGSTGLMARTICCDGRRLQAGQAIDLNVDQDHRSAGPALGLQRAVTSAVNEGKLDLVYGFPDAKSELVLRRVGYNTLGTLRRWAKPLSSEEPLKAWLRHRLARKPTSLVVDSWLRLTSPETFYRRPDDVAVSVTDHFDARFDLLWQKAAGQFAVIGERTSAYLAWRFGRCPQTVHRAFCLSSAQEELLAYLVYSRRNDTVLINDFFFADPRDFDALLAEFVRQMRREQAQAILTVFFGASLVSHRLAEFGFWERPSTWKTMVYADQQALGPEGARLLDPQSWFLTRADIDTDD